VTSAARMDETYRQIEMVRDYIESTNQECEQPCDYLEILSIIDRIEDTLLGKPIAEPSQATQIAGVFIDHIPEPNCASDDIPF